MVDLATKSLLHDKLRFLITVSGVAELIFRMARSRTGSSETTVAANVLPLLVQDRQDLRRPIN